MKPRGTIVLYGGLAVLVLFLLSFAFARWIHLERDRIEASSDYGRPPHARSDAAWASFVTENRRIYREMAAERKAILLAQRKAEQEKQAVEAAADAASTTGRKASNRLAATEPESKGESAGSEESRNGGRQGQRAAASVAKSARDPDVLPDKVSTGGRAPSAEAETDAASPSPDPARLSPVAVAFASASSEVGAADRKKLAEVAAKLEKHAILRVRLEAFTDPSGSAAYNARLRKFRAGSTRDVLIELGVSPGRISIGSTSELADRHEDADALEGASSRRVEVWYHDTAPEALVSR